MFRFFGSGFGGSGCGASSFKVGYSVMTLVSVVEQPVVKIIATKRKSFFNMFLNLL